WAVDVVGQAPGNGGAQLFDGFAGSVYVTDVGIKERAVGTYQASVGVELLLRARRRGQLWVIPHGDVEQVVGADAIGAGFEVDQFLLAGGAHVGYQVALEHFRGDLQKLDVVFTFRATFLEFVGVQILARGKGASLNNQQG